MTDSRLREIAENCFPESFWSTMSIPKGFRITVRYDIEKALISETQRAREEERERTIRECIEIVRTSTYGPVLSKIPDDLEKKFLNLLSPKESEEGKP